jgi:hypothetical protein
MRFGKPPLLDNRGPIAAEYLHELVRRDDVVSLTYHDGSGRLLAFANLLDHPVVPLYQHWSALSREEGGKQHLYFDSYARMMGTRRGARSSGVVGRTRQVGPQTVVGIAAPKAVGRRGAEAGGGMSIEVLDPRFDAEPPYWRELRARADCVPTGRGRCCASRRGARERRGLLPCCWTVRDRGAWSVRRGSAPGPDGIGSSSPGGVGASAVSTCERPGVARSPPGGSPTREPTGAFDGCCPNTCRPCDGCSVRG